MFAHRSEFADYLPLMRWFVTLFCICTGTALAEKPKMLPLMSAPPKAVKAVPEAVVALPNYDEVTATRLQIFLDNNDFGPGKIDGQMGEFFRKALLSLQTRASDAAAGNGGSMAS